METINLVAGRKGWGRVFYRVQKQVLVQFESNAEKRWLILAQGLL